MTEIEKAIKKLRQNLEYLQRTKANPKKIGIAFGVTTAIESYYQESANTK